MNEALDQQLATLDSLLKATLSVDDFLDFESLKQIPDIRPFEPGRLAIAEARPEEANFSVPPLGARKLVPGAKAKHTAAVAEAAARYESALVEHEHREQQRLADWRDAQDRHEQQNADLLKQATAANEELEAFRAEFEAGDPDAIVSYFDMVLQRSAYPDSFPRHFRLAYVPGSMQLVVEFELPTISVVPTAKAYRYVKSKDEVSVSPRAASHIKTVYADVIAQVALRTVHELFEADRRRFIDSLVLNCYVDTTDPATGKAIRPTLVTLRTTRDVFGELDLAHVEPLVCLKSLGAGVSKSPNELLPVRPVLEFDMVDRRFVQETDILSGLDQRPNLMELTPNEFENLITNLFAKMGLETRLTQASRDGGVDCVAFDPRPIFGGKVVIQAKRYKGTVGVSAVRDLFGTVHNEGASKGILVSTSGYGHASFEFANGKPLELIDGSGLLYLLAEHAGLEARIVPPEDWVDPASAALA
jgi:restriction system protein